MIAAGARGVAGWLGGTERHGVARRSTTHPQDLTTAPDGSAVRCAARVWAALGEPPRPCRTGSACRDAHLEWHDVVCGTHIASHIASLKPQLPCLKCLSQMKGLRKDFNLATVYPHDMATSKPPFLVRGVGGRGAARGRGKGGREAGR